MKRSRTRSVVSVEQQLLLDLVTKSLRSGFKNMDKPDPQAVLRVAQSRMEHFRDVDVISDYEVGYDENKAQLILRLSVVKPTGFIRAKIKVQEG